MKPLYTLIVFSLWASMAWATSKDSLSTTNPALRDTIPAEPDSVAISDFLGNLPIDDLDAELPDTTDLEGLVEEKRFLTNLDSMVHLWYVQQAIQADTLLPRAFLPDSVLMASLPDSVYEQRLADIESVIDMTFSPLVKRRIEMYTIRGRRYVQTMIGLSQYYFPMFEEVLDSYQMPLELKYLPIVESALNPRAVSFAGATGIWQFMYATGKIYQLEINTLVDERRDPLQASHAAAKFLKKLHEVYNDWTLALAAYNCGPGNVNKAIRRSGGKTNYWEIYPYLPRETRGYVPAFIAASYLMNYFDRHEIIPRPTEFPMVTDTLRVKDRLHLAQVSEVLGIPMKQLQDLNPQYRLDIIPKPADKAYAIRLPLEYTTRFIELEDSIYSYKDSIFFAPKASYVADAVASYGLSPADLKGRSKIDYTIRTGDNLGAIAKRFGVSVANLKAWNGMYSNKLRAGNKLVVYVGKKSNNAAAKADASVTEPISTVKPSDANYVYHMVRRGDNLWTIAQQYPGITDKDLMRINNFSASHARSLQAGQWIKVKAKM